jgi:uncharacterized repeat protein (TIGR03843 family)
VLAGPELLRTGEVAVLGRLPWSSNATLLVEVCDDVARSLAVYKPVAGERPLWDFPPGLHRREAAAYELSEALGWSLIPPTIVRDDAPHGMGSLQAFVEADHDQHYFTILEDDAHGDRLRALCTFDLVANSADRKGGHVLIATDGTIWGIDNGLCFAPELKLRTVIWDFAGEPVPPMLLEGLASLVDAPLPEALSRLLDPDECEALVSRARALVDGGRFPHDPTGRRWPWPLV